MFVRTVAAWALATSFAAAAQEDWIPAIPDDFPRYGIAGHEGLAAALREINYLHYGPSGPLATIWDEWISAPSLWPATDGGAIDRRNRWRDALLGRILDAEGYVATHQHASIAHPLGWPFPFWKQGKGGWGHHFVTPPGLSPNWHAVQAQGPEGWQTAGITDNGVGEAGWQLAMTEPNATIAIGGLAIDPKNAPFIQIRWRLENAGYAQPYLDWTTAEAPEFSPERRMFFDAPSGAAIAHQVVPVFEHPQWTGTVTGLRIGFGNPAAAGDAVVEAVFTVYDTRHTVNNPNFIEGSANYFNWTGDLAFLRANINRMRRALRYAVDEFQTEEYGVITCPWVGHDGLSGHVVAADGSRTTISGNGVGNNYWDLMPFGWKDAYGTVYFYDALLKLADIEEAIRANPGWNIPLGGEALDPAWLREHAFFVKAKFNEIFWHPETGRYACSVDVNGTSYDYGYTFLNLEAIHYGLAPDDNAAAIMAWMTGDRIVEGDTAQGADIYHWRFGPRATTRRNIEYYLWAWGDPASIPWGGQVQDGGAVFGWSYHDLMARLHVLGPDNAAARLGAIGEWFGEVKAAGGYRKYYDGSRDGTLQGGGVAGGLGLDNEFFESILVPQIVLDGFLGVKATPTGLTVAPNLPAGWPEAHIERIAWRDCVLAVTASANRVTVAIVGPLGAFTDEPLAIFPGPGWTWALDEEQPFEKKADSSVSFVRER